MTKSKPIQIKPVDKSTESYLQEENERNLEYLADRKQWDLDSIIMYSKKAMPEPLKDRILDSRYNDKYSIHIQRKQPDAPKLESIKISANGLIPEGGVFAIELDENATMPELNLGQSALSANFSHERQENWRERTPSREPYRAEANKFQRELIR